MNSDTSQHLGPFPTVEIPTQYGPVTIPHQQIAPGISVTPYLDRTETEHRFGGGFTLTHTPSGRVFAAGQACIECATVAARQIAGTGLDWTQADISTAETMHAFLGDHRETVGKALRGFTKCVQQVCAVGDDGVLEECEACGFTGSHAPYCIDMVLPMVAEQNSRALAKETTR